MAPNLASNAATQEFLPAATYVATGLVETHGVVVVVVVGDQDFTPFPPSLTPEES
jgi:hypothetical protein